VNVVHKANGKTDAFSYNPSCADGTGWRYDNADDARRIVLCDASCTDVRAKSGQVDVLFGCATKFGAVK
jgi:hypothetical protein